MGHIHSPIYQMVSSSRSRHQEHVLSTSRGFKRHSQVHLPSDEGRYEQALQTGSLSGRHHHPTQSGRLHSMYTTTMRPVAGAQYSSLVSGMRNTLETSRTAVSSQMVSSASQIHPSRPILSACSDHSRRRSRIREDRERITGGISRCSILSTTSRSQPPIRPPRIRTV